MHTEKLKSVYIFANTFKVIFGTCLCKICCRKLLYQGSVLWSGDELGSVCQWSQDLSSCHLKKEYYTEIWSMLVSRDNNTLYTARDNEIIIANVSSGVASNNSNIVLVNSTLPGESALKASVSWRMNYCRSSSGGDEQ